MGTNKTIWKQSVSGLLFKPKIHEIMKNFIDEQMMYIDKKCINDITKVWNNIAQNEKKPTIVYTCL